MGQKLFRPNIMPINTGSVTLSKVLKNSDLYACRTPSQNVEFKAFGTIQERSTSRAIQEQFTTRLLQEHMASFSLISSPPLLPKPKDPFSHAFPHSTPFVLRMANQPQHLQTPLLLPKIQYLCHQTTGICLVIYLFFHASWVSCLKLLG